MTDLQYVTITALLAYIAEFYILTLWLTLALFILVVQEIKRLITKLESTK